MKMRNIIISALIVVVCVQFFFIIKFYKQKQTLFTEHPELIVKDFVKNLMHNYRNQSWLNNQAEWALRHLANCIKLLESERGLEPIQIEYPADYWNSVPAIKLAPTSAKFWIPYEKRKQVEYEITDEEGLLILAGSISVPSSYDWSIEGNEYEIDNYQKRLQRLDPNNKPSIDKP